MTDPATTNKLAWFTTDRWERLHHVPRCDDGHYVWEAVVEGDLTTVVTACGRAIEPRAPGLFSRLAMPRCAHCCRLLGIPPGEGTPANWHDRPGMTCPPEWGGTQEVNA